MKIASVDARSVFDSRGFPTVEAEVTLENGLKARSIVPSGASTGEREAIELRDGGKAFNGKTVDKAVANIAEKIAPEIAGKDAADQKQIDKHLIELDGTSNKQNLGANAILAVSLASAHAEAAAKSIPLYEHINSMLESNINPRLPVPMVNIFNGGVHAAQSTAIQEFMLVPDKSLGYKQAIFMCAEIFHSLGSLLKSKSYPTTVGDEGGYAPGIKSDEEVLDILSEAVESAGFELGKDVNFALDVAASEFMQDGGYQINNNQLSKEEMIDWLVKIRRKYPIVSIEDGLDENDWDGWSDLTTRLGQDTLLVGDDLLTTNTHYLDKAIQLKAGNSILIKLNQIGTLTETLQTIEQARSAGWDYVISHRSGETEDTTISHLAVGTAAPYIKTGSTSRGERTAKYNELLRIAESV